ncbi:hypothetical protein [Pseudoalteromonas sp. Z9A5]|uniref:hypothetical protein n=1 Tax=Pseudoalteromonas sp. Z9A5 TaxID=2686355 RepID=UPI001F0FAEBB|nr:hypothetical protein [Pseudoalteromonas sp. Z9A5]
MSKRDLFSELTTTLVDAKAHSQSVLTLQVQTVSELNDLAISTDEIVNIPEISRIHKQERSKIGSKGAVLLMGKQLYY